MQHLIPDHVHRRRASSEGNSAFDHRAVSTSSPPMYKGRVRGGEGWEGHIWAGYNCDPWICSATLTPHIAWTQRQILYSKALKGHVICCSPWYCNESSWSANVLISIHYRGVDLKACTASGQMVHAETYWRSIKSQNIHKHPLVTHAILTLPTNILNWTGNALWVHNSCSFMKHYVLWHNLYRATFIITSSYSTF